MAGAAAKKAATAKHETAKIYMPILIFSNILYVVLMLGTSNSIPYNGTKFGIFSMIVTWLMQVYSYVGLLESAAIAATASSKSKDLAGGANLDLFVATVVTQFLSILHSPRWFYITLIGVPVTAAYKLYVTFYDVGKSNTTVAPSKNNGNQEEEDRMEEKRQRRKEKRRTKRC
mmetsp:Transcript_50179/g.56045  ORF Transcript_50179/g.56045 Transcript_50179/m.56045 type:complete len:173 (-) Transcript_50179:137-655(-)